MKPRPKPGSRSNGAVMPVIKYLLPIPMVLAAIALVLQIVSHHPSQDMAAFGLFNENDFHRKSDKIPRLEAEVTKRRIAARSDRELWHSASNDLAGEDWAWPGPDAAGPKIAFTVTTAESVSQIRIWLSYHRALGVSLFYLFVEGQANLPSAIDLLRKEPGVTVIPKDEELAKKHASSNVWNENWLSAFFNKPCNHELFVTQSLNMEIGIQLASKDGANWILHIDTDELIYPGGSAKYSLQEVLASVPNDVDLLIFPNYESLAESTTVKDPFTEVSLFKRNYAHVSSDEYFKHYAEVQRANPNYFTTYGNGKSAARIIPGLRPNGAHRWHNYYKMPKEWSSDQSAVLHYTYNRFADLKSRRDRCDCAPTNQDAERCFILPFDREAFLQSSLKSDKELMRWFKERLVWDDGKSVDDLLKEGLFVRLYEPQLMVRGFKEAERIHSENEQRQAALGITEDEVNNALNNALVNSNNNNDIDSLEQPSFTGNGTTSISITTTETVDVGGTQPDDESEKQQQMVQAALRRGVGNRQRIRRKRQVIAAAAANTTNGLADTTNTINSGTAAVENTTAVSSETGPRLKKEAQELKDKATQQLAQLQQQNAQGTANV